MGGNGNLVSGSIVEKVGLWIGDIVVLWELISFVSFSFEKGLGRFSLPIFGDKLISPPFVGVMELNICPKPGLLIWVFSRSRVRSRADPSLIACRLNSSAVITWSGSPPLPFTRTKEGLAKISSNLVGTTILGVGVVCG